MRCRWFAVALVIFGCKKTPPGEQPSPGSSSAPVPIAIDAAVVGAPTWTAKSQPIELACGNKPLTLPAPMPAPAPAADRTLSHDDGITQCHDQATVAAACACLAGSTGVWATSLRLSTSADCKPVSQNADAQIVEVTSQPADTDAKSGGNALVLVAKHGAKWSAVAVVDSEPDIDLSQTPRMTEHSGIAKFEAHPLVDGQLYWIVSQTETQDTSTGDVDHDGGMLGTICVAPTNPNTPAFCYTPLKLGAWTYAAADSTCTITKLVTLSATLDATSATLRLDHGSDTDGLAGHYLF
jgi:hypothetical protein